MASKKKSTKGKRYSPAEKQEIIDFVNTHNAARGRGGQSAASKKYGVSQLTISGWLKKVGASSSPAAASRGSSAPKGRAAKGGRGSALAELTSLQSEIDRRRKELDELEAKFQSVKGRL